MNKIIIKTTVLIVIQVLLMPNIALGWGLVFQTDKEALSPALYLNTNIFQSVYQQACVYSKDKDKVSFDLLNEMKEWLFSQDPEELRKGLINTASNLVHAESGSIILFAEDNPEYVYFATATGKYAQEIEKIQLNIKEKSFTSIAIKNRKAFFINNVPDNADFSPAVDSFTGHITRSILCMPLIVEGETIGALELINKINADFNQTDLENIKKIADLGAIAIQRLNKMSKKDDFIKSLLNVLTTAIEEKDPYTKGHGDRTRRYALLIAKRIGLNIEFLQQVDLSATLHDAGKIVVASRILNKPSRLNDEEFNEIKKHSEKGKNIVSAAQSAKFIEILPNIGTHHERWDGKGYPKGLKGEKIPLIGRIIAVADAFDAMTSNRPYRKKMPFEKAIKILIANKGKQFDAKIVDIFVEILQNPEIKKTIINNCIDEALLEGRKESKQAIDQLTIMPDVGVIRFKGLLSVLKIRNKINDIKWPDFYHKQALQECLVGLVENSLKHGQKTSVLVYQIFPDKLKIIIQNKGEGVDVKTLRPRKPLGVDVKDDFNSTISYTIWKICEEVVGKIKGKITYLSKGMEMELFPDPENNKKNGWAIKINPTIKMQSKKGVRVEIEIPFKEEELSQIKVITPQIKDQTKKLYETDLIEQAV
ncbi:MAG: HD domain-containing phosphohydrolase [Candidatus Omnitrophota bacterium]